MKSLWKWCTVAIVAVTVLGVLVGTPGGKAQDSGWTTQAVVQGPDASGRRVVTPDVTVATDGKVYVSYIKQQENAVRLILVGGEQRDVEVAKPENRVLATTVAASDTLVCVGWGQLGDAGPEVWHRCLKTADLSPASDPVRVSGEGLIAGVHSFEGTDYFYQFDNSIAPDGTAYVVWSEDYSNLKAARFAPDGTMTACGDMPQSTDLTRYPTIYVDNTGVVWVASNHSFRNPDILVWFSNDQCASWQGPVNTSNNSGFSDGAGIVRIGDKLYQVNDDDTTNPNYADIHINICDITENGLANCASGKIVYKDGGFPHIATDGTGLYVTSFDGGVLYAYSCDAGATWTQVNVPNSAFSAGIRDPDFGTTYTRHRIATGANSGNVYIVWTQRVSGASWNIMLSTRPKDCPSSP